MTADELDDNLTMPLDNEPQPTDINTSSGQFPISVDTRFEYVRQLGRGGSGLVYQAYDHKLQRHVALKFLLNPLPQQQQRLIGEARAQANVEHPNICPIYEIIEAADGIYLVMQYVEGKSLQQLAAGLTLEQLIIVMNNTAQGLQAAHAQGLNHRDLKPANIMVNLESDNLTPLIVDFGLAAHSDQESKGNSYVGTKGFVAPELYANNNKKLDRRSDIYSLGACLFSCLTGHTFEPTNEAPILTQLSQFDLPKDVKHIIAQSLQPDPDLRYQSAAAFAADLARFLAGEPINARTGKFYWIKRKVVKHKWVAMVTSIAIITLSAMYGKQLYNDHQQSIREQALITFNSQLKELEYEAQLTYLSPRHNIENKRQRWLEEAQKLESNLANSESILLGATHYAIGRIYQILDIPEKALVHLEQAHSLENTSDTAFYLSLSYGKLYERHLSSVRNIEDDITRSTRITEIENKYKRPAQTLLESGLQSAPYQSYATALLAYYEGNWQKAVSLLGETTDLPNWFYQDKVLIGNALLAQANDKQDAGLDYKVVAPYLDEAQQYFQQAINIAQSDPNVQLSMLKTTVTRMQLLNQTGNKADESLVTLATQIKNKTLEIDSQNPMVHFYYGQLLEQFGSNTYYHIGGAESWFQQAEKELLTANKMHPNSDATLYSLAKLYNSLIKLKRESNQDSNLLIDKAIATLDRMSEESRDYHYYNQLGTLNRYKALYLRDGGEVEDSQPYFELAIESYVQANKKRPENIGSLVNAASTMKKLAEKKEPEERYIQLGKASDLLNNVLQQEPNHFVANYYLTVIYFDFVELALYHHQNQQDVFEKANQQLEKLLKINDSHPYVLSEKQRLLQFEAEHQFTTTGTWGDKMDLVLERGKELAQKYPENTLLVHNHIGVQTSFTFIRALLKLPYDTYLDELDRALATYPEFENREAYSALVHILRHWHKLALIESDIAVKFKLSEKSSFAHMWALGVAIITSADSQKDIDKGVELINNNLGLLPAYRQLLLDWVQKTKKLTEIN